MRIKQSNFLSSQTVVIYCESTSPANISFSDEYWKMHWSEKYTQKGKRGRKYNWDKYRWEAEVHGNFTCMSSDPPWVEVVLR